MTKQLTKVCMRALANNSKSGKLMFFYKLWQIVVALTSHLAFAVSEMNPQCWVQVVGFI